MNYLYMLLAFEFVLLLFIVTITNFDFLSPGFITIIMFILSTLSVIWNEKFWDVQFKQETFVVISSGLLLVVLTEFIVKAYYANRKLIWMDKEAFCSQKAWEVDPGIKLLIIVAIFVLAIFYVIAVIRKGGSFGSVLSSIGVVHSDDDLSVGVFATIALRICRLVPYPSLFVLAFNINVKNQSLRHNLWLSIPIACGCIVVFFSGVRSTYIYYILAGVLYFVIFDRFKHGWKNINIFKYWRQIIFFGILFLAIFVGTRSIVKNHDFLTSAVEYITFYLGSPLHLFNKNIDNLSAVFVSDFPFAYLFTWLFQELSNFGLFNIDITAVKFSAVGGGWSGGGNVYTFFAAPLHDLGLFGMLIFTFVFYLIFDIIYYKKFRYAKRLSNSMNSLLLYGSMYHYVIMTFYTTLTSQFKFQTILEMFIIVIILKIMLKVKIQ